MLRGVEEVRYLPDVRDTYDNKTLNFVPSYFTAYSRWNNNLDCEFIRGDTYRCIVPCCKTPER